MTLYPSPIGHVEVDCIGDSLKPVPDSISIRRDPRPPRLALGSLPLRRRPR
jgi:hypothetical protein